MPRTETPSLSKIRNKSRVALTVLHFCVLYESSHEDFLLHNCNRERPTFCKKLNRNSLSLCYVNFQMWRLTRNLRRNTLFIVSHSGWISFSLWNDKKPWICLTEKQFSLPLIYDKLLYYVLATHKYILMN